MNKFKLSSLSILGIALMLLCLTDIQANEIKINDNHGPTIENATMIGMPVFTKRFGDYIHNGMTIVTGDHAFNFTTGTWDILEKELKALILVANCDDLPVPFVKSCGDPYYDYALHQLRQNCTYYYMTGSGLCCWTKTCTKQAYNDY
jgi:hypothetical protein